MVWKNVKKDPKTIRIVSINFKPLSRRLQIVLLALL